MKSLRQVGPLPGAPVITSLTMIEQWILEDERELEARCARFRAAQRTLEHGDGGDEIEEEDSAA
ncbi:hypothetical protein GCM10009850_010050 [Nonomuraea monospora]|uniref:Uncharacterized protein n=1 Tax=Nonomuraea monospora TaxID=568818 RepID=A0ABN3C8H4_9ACTN